MKAQETLAAALYVVATPIGHLDDITLRALDVLRRVEFIACEDTRHTRTLLDHHGIVAPARRLIALHQHNEQAAASRLVDLLKAGESVALVSDAGTPGIADPGARAVAAVRAAGGAVIPLPGANAAICALSVAGLLAERALFVGFLPSGQTARRKEIAALAQCAAALVLYEAPHRIAATLSDLAELLEPTRSLLVARELTKLFEQIALMPLSAAPAWLSANANHQRGEFVLVISPPPRAVDAPLDGRCTATLRVLLDELPTKQAVRLAAAMTGAPRNALYQHALTLQRPIDSTQ